MTKLRLVPYRVLKSIAERQGYVWIRCIGSHNVFRDDEGRVVVIPDHGSQVIVRPLLRKILRDMRITVDEYTRMLNELARTGSKLTFLF